MTKESIVLYPVTIKIGNDYSSYKSSLKNIVNQHSNNQWVKLIKEFKKFTKVYNHIYGIKITNVKRYKRDFIRSTVEVIDEEKFKNWEEKNNLSGVFASFINHDLNAGGYPSFYKDNNEDGKMISSFVVVETKKVKNL